MDASRRKSIREKYFATIFIATIAILPFCFVNAAYAADGSSSSPWEISNCTDFQNIGTGGFAPEDYYVVTTNFSCSSITNFTPILITGGFKGNFNGQGHTISDITITNPAEEYVGPFSWIYENAIVKNINFTNVTISSDISYVGGLAGYNEGTIENSSTARVIHNTAYTGGITGYNIGDVTDSHSSVDIDDSTDEGDGYYAGGLIGWSAEGIISNSYSTGDIDGYYYTGGFIGGSDLMEISDSYSTGNVTVVSGYNGGFIGYDYSSVITRSCATGDLTASSNDDNNGGFIGWTSYSNDSLPGTNISQSFATGDVVSGGGGGIGAFAGQITNGSQISDCYSRGSVTSDGSPIAGFVGSVVDSSVTRSYSTGEVNDDSGDVAGFIASVSGSTVTNSFWDIETSGEPGDASNATGKPTEEMKDIDLYTILTPDVLSVAWDFTGTQNDDTGTEDIWTFSDSINDDYPLFSWQIAEPQTTETTTDTPTGKEVTLEWDSGCSLNAFNVKSESVNSTQDIAFEYPNGMVNFTLESCDDSTVNINIYYVDVEGNSFVGRKYNPVAGSYTTISDAAITTSTSEGHVVTKLSYSIVDNGSLDIDPTVGVISDPVGVAQAVLGAPRTGGGGTAK